MLPNLFEDLAPPVQGQVILLPHSVTAARYEIPATWRGCMVTFTSVGSDLYISFGTALVMISTSEDTIKVGEVLAASFGSGAIIPAGGSLSVPIPEVRNHPHMTHFAVHSSAATGNWSAYVSSGSPTYGEELDPNQFPRPILQLDANARHLITTSPGAQTMTGWHCRATGAEFTEAAAFPDLLDVMSGGSGMLNASAEFLTASSEKMLCANTTLAAALGGVKPFTLLIAAKRTVAGANHCLFSVATAGTDNGRWDVMLDASDDFVLTRVSAAGVSATSTHAATFGVGMHTILLTFDGVTPKVWIDGTSRALTGLANGDVGTPTRLAIGCRARNTSTQENFASVELSEVLAFSEALTEPKLTNLLAWARRKFGV